MKLAYIYIFTNLLSTSIHGYQEKEKKKRQNLEIAISRITACGKKKKHFFGKKKKRPTSSHQLKKIKRYAISWPKEQKPTVKCCNATITTSAQY